MIVVDSNVLATALGDDGEGGDRIRRRLLGEQIAAPEIIELEALSVWRRMVAAGMLSPPRAAQAVSDLTDMAFQRVPHRMLVARCWTLRDNVSVYDASYVAVAEILGVKLLTGDVRLSRAPGPQCEFEVLS